MASGSFRHTCTFVDHKQIQDIFGHVIRRNSRVLVADEILDISFSPTLNNIFVSTRSYTIIEMLDHSSPNS